ncbi:hypothetical protein C5B42_01600 [Candidatus Cerribacteria bacterium 'Amazon FNV 2010 28 9']|uniref:Uncharacterized protein n=1 Tax=Candidatus Cerribacteria bacterium 'Amazon FNV 2010 28 9' TaxID=2081795 RepID=A0A317JTK0_9BACT|nr:MAG: hypothetical protein C5B42_01600 [Candidatus Cerribacteria bacterium 'Amazon FNV 2010 28 9']
MSIIFLAFRRNGYRQHPDSKEKIMASRIVTKTRKSPFFPGQKVQVSDSLRHLELEYHSNLIDFRCPGAMGKMIGRSTVTPGAVLIQHMDATVALYMPGEVVSL